MFMNDVISFYIAFFALRILLFDGHNCLNSIRMWNDVTITDYRFIVMF